MRTFALTSLVLAPLAFGCGGPNPPSTEVDAATPPSADAAVARACERVPTDSFGSRQGRHLEDFTLPQCDGTDYSFYNEDFCSPDHTLTVVSIAAEWCVPCQQESAQLTDRIVLPYRDRGVRLIQVLVQNQSYGPPDLDLCSRWVARFHLDQSVELIDPLGVVAPAFPSDGLPSTLVVDETGTILFREDGTSDGLVTLRAELDRALAARGR